VPVPVLVPVLVLVLVLVLLLVLVLVPVPALALALVLLLVLVLVLVPAVLPMAATCTKVARKSQTATRLSLRVPRTAAGSAPPLTSALTRTPPSQLEALPPGVVNVVVTIAAEWLRLFSVCESCGCAYACTTAECMEWPRERASAAVNENEPHPTTHCHRHRWHRWHH
jgi:hypothetical protein